MPTASPTAPSPAPAPRARRLDPALAASRLWPLAAAVAIAFVTWPVGSLTPANGLDPSWRLALHMAVARGVDFGDIAFTYGPLGVLEVPLNAQAHTLLPSLVWIAVLQVALAWLVIECGRRTLGWPAALALAFVACVMLDEGREVLPLVAFLWAALVVQWGVPDRLGRALLPVSGVVAGASLLIKFNEGVVALLLVGVAAWWLGPARWRGVGVAAGSALAAIVVLWVATGNAIGGLGDWLLASARIASGYSAGLPYEAPGRGWEYPLFLAVVGAITWFGWLSVRDLPRGRRVGAALIWALFAFSLWKHGFVRHDLGHSGSSFTALIAAAAAVRWSGRAGRLAGGAVCAATVVAALVVYGTADGRSTWSFLDPRPRAETAAAHLELALSPGERAEDRREARRELAELHALPPPVLAALREGTVHVDPYETSIVWAYGLDWQPLPVFQAYSIYTEALDELNAEALRGDDAPERILRHGGARIDNHAPEGEGPHMLRAMICGYREQVAVTGWQVLARAPWRCGEPRTLSRVTARVGEQVPIPPAPSPEHMVTASIALHPGPVERLRTTLHKPRHEPSVILNEGYAFRIPAAVAAGPLLVRAPASVGWAPYAPGFTFDTLRVSSAPTPFEVEFVATRVAPPGG